MSRRLSAALAMPAIMLVAALASGCSSATHPADPTPPVPNGATPSMTNSDSPTSSRLQRSNAATPTDAASHEHTRVPEPTTTNTLPAPLRPSKPAPSTAGSLSAKSLPVPEGWKTVVRKGGAEEGYVGNGTWVHGRDPRYAAQDVITLGCAVITRDDYTDPTVALEGSYQSRAGEPGIGLVLQFGREADAAGYFRRYRQQVAACTAQGGPVQTQIISSELGLIDRRSYPDGDWTEVAAIEGGRLTLIILSDPGHKISKGTAEKLLRSINQAKIK